MLFPSDPYLVSSSFHYPLSFCGDTFTFNQICLSVSVFPQRSISRRVDNWECVLVPGSSPLPPVGVVVCTNALTELPADLSAEPDQNFNPFLQVIRKVLFLLAKTILTYSSQTHLVVLLQLLLLLKFVLMHLKEQRCLRTSLLELLKKG